MKNKKLFAILTLVCFMFTLMPVAAFAAGTPAADMSYFVATDGDQTITEAKALAGVEFDLILQAADDTAADRTAVYFWAKDANGTISSALDASKWGSPATKLDCVWVGETQSDRAKMMFTRAGEYTVYAGIAKKGVTEVTSMDQINVFGEPSVIKVNGTSANPEEDYTATFGSNVDAAVDTVLGTITLVPNNVATKYTVSFENDDKALRNKTVAISTNSSSIEVNKETATTNSIGAIDFKVAASVEGTYEIELEIDGVSWTIAVQVGSTSAAYIELNEQPAAPQALYGTMAYDKVTFLITDINGNVVDSIEDGGMSNVNAQDGKYIVLTEKPADSNLESENLTLKYEDGVWGLNGVTKDAEGTYAVKVILDNGAFATATWEVKKFQKPVQLVIGTSTDVVELGGKIGGELLYFDVNGVQKNADDAKIAVTGYAVAGVGGDQKFQVSAKDDEKYVGSTITVTAVSEKYDLVATKEIKVADGAVAVAFVDKAADVNVNNKLTWNVVDSNGTRVALGNTFAAADIKYVVLDKPADAKVSVNDATNLDDLKNKGIGKMALTSNKVGNVTVQVIVKAEYNNDETDAKQVKYYTGTQIFAVGTKSVGDVVVMSVGSNEIVINDAKATIDAAPIVENNRTFVPFRALAEAFGATVAFDEATQAVTAELNGVTVVMTIGSAEYTVNGVAKTADVAPFINGSRTMVPVRFAAEAFGIKVIPTYDENGATADILFNL